MKDTKTQRQQHRGRPEAEHLRNSELGIAAGEEFFIDSNDEEEHAPEHRKFHNAQAMQRKCSEVKTICSAQGEQQYGERGNSPHCAHPEQLAKGQARRQTVAAEWPLFQAAHN